MSACDDYLAIVNPAAGGGRCGRFAEAALTRLREAGLMLHVVSTHGPGEATRLARRARERGARRFIAVGGDGTAHEVLNGMLGGAAAEERLCLGLLPLGTGNSFLRDFTSGGAEAALQAIVEGRRRPCDVIRVELDSGVRRSLNVVGLGFGAEVNVLAARHFKRLGAVGYACAVVAGIARLRDHVFPMTLDGGARCQRPSSMVAVCNSRFTGGGMMIAPQADTADGWLDVIFVGSMSRARLLRSFPMIFQGSHLSHPAVRSARARRVDLDVREAIDLMIDGEAIRDVPRRLAVETHALEVMV